MTRPRIQKHATALSYHELGKNYYVTAIASAHAQWSVEYMSTPRYDMRTAHFDTGAVFVTSSWERYDATNDVWSNGLLSDPRIGIAVAQAGTKAYFAGGKKGPFTDYIYVKSVDVYDDATHAWSKTTLSAEREVGGAGEGGSGGAADVDVLEQTDGHHVGEHR